MLLLSAPPAAGGGGAEPDGAGEAARLSWEHWQAEAGEGGKAGPPHCGVPFSLIAQSAPEKQEGHAQTPPRQ